MLQAVDVEFPPEIVAACVAAYVRTPPQHPAFSKHRRNGRSFPTDYRLPDDEESIAEVIARTTRELDVHRGPGPLVWSQTRQSVAADKRVFAGPSPSDVAALPHIGEAWCVAEFICAELGLRADTWTVQGLRRAHLRYGLLLDWATRDVARRLARDRDGISMPEALHRPRVSSQTQLRADELSNAPSLSDVR